MDVRIVKAEEWLVVGMSFYGDPFAEAPGWSEDNEIGLLWRRFDAFLGERGDALKHVVEPDVALEIHISTEETTQKGLLEVFVGVRVTELENVPLECVVKVLPPTEYGVFTLRGQEIRSDWYQTIYQDWMPSSGYHQSGSYSIQYYDERFKGLDRIEESVLDVYIPIERDA
jgi:predicted transcriptional regulator YdeE